MARITPACAGTTSQVAARLAEYWGSPPRVRGLRIRRADRRHLHRITPACAGTTSWPMGRSPKSRDHPRVCGDYMLGMLNGWIISKSPPRVRGLHTHHAGGAGRRRGDHPRVCGDYPWFCLPLFVARGSPPRVRGLLPLPLVVPDLVRITPACAGTTLRDLYVRRGDQDHPRVCGDYWSAPRFTSGSTGSPPRVRGLLGREWDSFIAIRITPACAGTTAKTGATPSRP